MKISLGVLLGVSFGVSFGLAGATTVASAQDPFAQDTVIVVEHADGPSPTVTEIPYQPPTPAAESALALDAPVVLILPPGSQVRVLDAELAQPVPEPPRVATPAPPIAPPQIPAPQVAATALQLEARLAELRRRRPGLGLPISLVAGGAFALGISSVALVEANFDCSWDDDCGRVPRMRGLVLASFATMTFGIVRLVINIIRRSRNSREIRAVRQELAAITHGAVLTWR